MRPSIRKATALFALMLLASGCAGSSGVNPRADLPYRAAAKVQIPVVPPIGILYTKVSAPVTTGPTSLGPKMGSSHSHSIGIPPLPFPGLETGVDLFTWGDSSQKAAAANGGITNVEHADWEHTIVLLFYRKTKMIAYGN